MITRKNKVEMVPLHIPTFSFQYDGDFRSFVRLEDFNQLAEDFDALNDYTGTPVKPLPLPRQDGDGIHCAEIAQYLSYNVGNAFALVWHSVLKKDLADAAFYVRQEINIASIDWTDGADPASLMPRALKDHLWEMTTQVCKTEQNELKRNIFVALVIFALYKQQSFLITAESSILKLANMGDKYDKQTRNRCRLGEGAEQTSRTTGNGSGLAPDETRTHDKTPERKISTVKNRRVEGEDLDDEV